MEYKGIILYKSIFIGFMGIGALSDWMEYKKDNKKDKEYPNKSSEENRGI